MPLLWWVDRLIQGCSRLWSRGHLAAWSEHQAVVRNGRSTRRVRLDSWESAVPAGVLLDSLSDRAGHCFVEVTSAHHEADR